MVLSIPSTKFSEFKAYLSNNGYIFEARPYQQFLARKAGMAINLYTNGKIVLGGTNQVESARIEEYLDSLVGNPRKTAHIKYAGGKIILKSPYGDAFVSELKNRLKLRRWDPEKKCWIVDIKERKELLEIVGRFYQVLEHNPPQESPVSNPRFTSEPIGTPSSVEISSVLVPSAKVTIWTDGACVVNPGPGGYGVVFKCQGQWWEKSGGFRLTTNNRMEIMAALVALESLPEKCKAIVYSDSRYLVNSISKGWAKAWRAKGWKTSGRKKAANADLWERMLQLCAQREVDFRWIQGHNSSIENERCDQLAESAARKADLPVDNGYISVDGDETNL